MKRLTFGIVATTLAFVCAGTGALAERTAAAGTRAEDVRVTGCLDVPVGLLLEVELELLVDSATAP